MNLTSITRLDDAGFKVTLQNGSCEITDRVTTIHGKKDEITNLYKIDDEGDERIYEHSNQALITRNDSIRKQKAPLSTWHENLGHLNTKTIERLVSESLMTGVEIIGDDGSRSAECKKCEEGKAERQDQDPEASKS